MNVFVLAVVAVLVLAFALTVFSGVAALPAVLILAVIAAAAYLFSATRLKR